MNFIASANAFSTAELNKTPIAFGIFNFTPRKNAWFVDQFSASLEKIVDYRNIYIFLFKTASERLNLNLEEKSLVAVSLV